MTTPEKLNQLLNYFNTNCGRLGKAIHKPQTFYDIRKGQIKNFSPEVVAELKKLYPEINENWLLFNEGEMIIKNKPIPTTEQKLQALDKIKIDDEKTTTYTPTPQKFAEKTYKKEVIVIPAKAQLGLQSYLFADEMMNDLEKKIINVDQDYKGRYYEIECVGDSMDANHRNAIREGDTVLCREISKLHWKNKFHKNDWEFVFFHNEYGIIIKSIKDQNLETGDLTLCSYNPDKEEFPDFTINIKDCYAICNVVQVLQNRKKYYTL